MANQKSDKQQIFEYILDGLRNKGSIRGVFSFNGMALALHMSKPQLDEILKTLENERKIDQHLVEGSDQFTIRLAQKTRMESHTIDLRDKGFNSEIKFSFYPNDSAGYTFNCLFDNGMHIQGTYNEIINEARVNEISADVQNHRDMINTANETMLALMVDPV